MRMRKKLSGGFCLIQHQILRKIFMKNSMKTVARIGQIGISSVHEVKQRPEIHKFKPEFSALPRDNQLCFMIFNLF